jgi:hypothetical protein
MYNNSAAAGDPFAHAGRKKRYKDLEGVDTVVRRMSPELLAAMHDARVLSSRDGGQNWQEIFRP